jgi:hypothetical protein
MAMSAQAAQAQSAFEVRKIVIAGANPVGADKAALDTFFGKGMLGALQAPSTGDKVPALRTKAYKNIIRGAAKNPALDYVNSLLLKGCTAILRGNYPPASKINALLLIGELNDSDATNNVKPLPGALPVLTMALNVPERMDYLKPPAMVGLKRFAQERAIPPAEAPKLQEALLKLVNQQDAPPGRTASAHSFLRRSAAEVLAAMGDPGPDNRVLKALAGIAADPNARLSLRCSMARQIGELKFPPDAKVDLQQVASALGRQTVENCRQELTRADAEDREPSRRLLMYSLDATLAGLLGLSNSAQGGAKDYIVKLRGKVYNMYRVLDDEEKTPDADLAAAVTTELTGIEEVLLATDPRDGNALMAEGPRSQ